MKKRRWAGKMGEAKDIKLPSAINEADMPEVILVGDSHTLALYQGCCALGINAAILKSGGIHWNQGKIRIFAPRRGRSPILPALRPDIELLQTRMDRTDIFDGSVPVIASIGFHCGHLARAFGAYGHVAWPPPGGLAVSDDEPVLFASKAMIRAFIDDRRSTHISLLRCIASRCNLTVILPPRAPKNEKKIRFRHNIDALTAVIAERVTSYGISVYDPNADFVGDDAILPWQWVNDDGFHGSPDYGKLVMERLIARGALGSECEQRALEK